MKDTQKKQNPARRAFAGLSANGRQTLFGAGAALAAVAAVLLFGGLAGGGRGAVYPLPQPCDAESVDALWVSRDESRYAAEESRLQEEESSRRAEENSRRMAEAEAGFREQGWHSAAEKDYGSGDPAVWGRFRDYAVLGDSRAVGFAYFHFLEWDRVLASGGDTIRRLPDRYADLKRLQPKILFFCYGLNDAGIGYWTDGETYAAEYMERIEEIRAFLPEAKFVVSSTLPVTDGALRSSPGWKRIELFNAALAAACPAHEVAFVNNDGLAKAYMETMWAADGVHLQETFYPYWANNLMEGLRRARAGAFYPDETTEEEALP